MDPNVKIIVFLVLILFILPFLTAVSCYFPFLRHAYFAGMLYFTTKEVSINFVPMPDWRGTARGYAFTAVSFFAVPLLFSMILSQYVVKLAYAALGTIPFYLLTNRQPEEARA